MSGLLIRDIGIRHTMLKLTNIPTKTNDLKILPYKYISILGVFPTSTSDSCASFLHHQCDLKKVGVVCGSAQVCLMKKGGCMYAPSTNALAMWCENASVGCMPSQLMYKLRSSHTVAFWNLPSTNPPFPQLTRLSWL